MGLTVTKKVSFEAGHLLPQHDGKCAQSHGHSYHVEIEVEGEPQKRFIGPFNVQTNAPYVDDQIAKENPKYGMIIDFADLKESIEDAFLKEFDHSYLNDIVLAPDDPPTTAEHLCIVIYKRMKDSLSSKYPNVKLVRVRVSETDSGYAEYKP